jgi:hypothetical protein
MIWLKIALLLAIPPGRAITIDLRPARMAIQGSSRPAISRRSSRIIPEGVWTLRNLSIDPARYGSDLTISVAGTPRIAPGRPTVTTPLKVVNGVLGEARLLKNDRLNPSPRLCVPRAGANFFDIAHRSPQLLRKESNSSSAIKVLRPLPIDDFQQASKDRIHIAITAVYDEKECSSEKPPNIRELPKLVQAKLAAIGCTASGALIMEIGNRPEHRGLLVPVGGGWSTADHIFGSGKS